MHTWIVRPSFRSKDPGSKLRGTQRVFSRMPDLDGPGFYCEVERRYPHFQWRVVFLTGDVLSPEAQAFFAHLTIHIW